MKVTCDYCKQPARLVGGAELYPHRRDLVDVKAWVCTPCGASVGCHDGTETPLGRLANAELRKAKIAAHDAFDPIWRERFEAKSKTDPKYTRGMARGGRYKALAAAMGIPKSECHIGMFDVDQCSRVVEICRSGVLSKSSEETPAV